MAATEILVGFDGSNAAQAALAWAVDEGVRCRAPVRLVQVLDGHQPTIDNLADARTRLDRLAAEIDDWGALGIPVTAEIFEGSAAPKLCELSREAGLVVVGDRGMGGFAGLRIGSVSLTVASYARCPVVVVRCGVAVPSRKSVAVGTDGSTHSELALRHAFAESAGRSVGVIVVRACVPAQVSVRQARERLDGELGVLRDLYPTVHVTTRLFQSTAAHALTITSHDAQLIVVGSRGCGGIHELVLGTTTQQLLQHSLCPVMVVRGSSGPLWTAPTAPKG